MNQDGDMGVSTTMTPFVNRQHEDSDHDDVSNQQELDHIYNLHHFHLGSTIVRSNFDLNRHFDPVHKSILKSRSLHSSITIYKACILIDTINMLNCFEGVITDAYIFSFLKKLARLCN